MILTTLLVMAAAVILPYSPVASYLGMVPLPMSFWPFMAGYLLAYSILTHLVKTWFNRRYGVSSK